MAHTEAKHMLEAETWIVQLEDNCARQVFAMQRIIKMLNEPIGMVTGLVLGKNSQRRVKYIGLLRIRWI